MSLGKSIALTVLLFFSAARLQASHDTLSGKSAEELLHYCLKNHRDHPDVTLRVSKVALVKARRENNEMQIGKAYEMIGVSEDYLGNFDKALVYFDTAAIYLKRQADQLPYAILLKSKGNSLFSLSRNKEALINYLQSLELLKRLGNPKEESGLLMGIGNVYSRMKLKQEALDYYFKSLEIMETIKDSTMMSYLYTNIAEELTLPGQEEEQLDFHRKAMLLKERLHDESGLVYSYASMGEMMMDRNKRDSALYFTRLAINTAQKVNNPYFLCTGYETIGAVFEHFNELDSADVYYSKLLYLATQIKTLKHQHSALMSLARVLQKKGEYKIALDRLFDYLEVHDTLYNVDMQSSIRELQMQYETDKKEKEIQILNERDKKTRWMAYSSIGGALLLGLLSLSLFTRYRLKKKTAHELETKNNVIQHQKEQVEEKNKEITDSINYANRIQQALLPSERFLAEHLKDYFILHLPKDIVSGDFYWALAHHNRFYVATADCTGHGVPGAFMSMLNISYFNEVVIGKNTVEPDLILNEVRREVIHALNPRGTVNESKDGMDCVLCAFDLEQMHLDFAAANNPLWLCRNGEIIDYAGDKMPVGKHDKEDQPFTRTSVALQKGDIIYTFTDGFADQFGGPKGKKFKYKQLHDVLLEICHMPMGRQKQHLDEVFSQWKGMLEQVDDVCIVGIKV